MSAPLRLTLLTDSKGFVHDVVKPAPDGTTFVQRELEAIACESGSFTVRTLGDASGLTRAALDQTDVVALYTSGDIELDVAGLDAWIRAGGALLGVHAATTTLQKDPAFTEIIGGVFNGHPWDANSIVTLKVHEPDHPAVAMIPPGYTLREEIYWHHRFDPSTVRVLMSLDMMQTPLKRPQHVPMVWCKPHGKGRVLYTSLGHREDVWTNSIFRRHLATSIEWLAGRRAGSAAPNPELSAAEQLEASTAAHLAAP